MPDWLMSAFIGALVAFVLNASFQTRRDMIASAVKGYAATERYRAILETRALILLHFADAPEDNFTKYWNATRLEARGAEAAVKVLVNTEFGSLKQQLVSLERALLRWSDSISRAGIKSYPSNDVAESLEVIHREFNHMQSKLLALSRPSWLRVFIKMLGID